MQHNQLELRLQMMIKRYKPLHFLQRVLITTHHFVKP
jgi:hypothetical protein